MTDNRDELTAQPTLTALLERVQKAETGLYQAIERLALRIEGQIQTVRSEVETVRGQVETVRGQVETVRGELHDEAQSLRDDIRTQFRKLETKIQLLIEDIMDVRANQRDLSKRMDGLEVKAL
ncbi:MAG: hypothetical protein WAU45_16330 [Blastocatellia bacterium]